MMETFMSVLIVTMFIEKFVEPSNQNSDSILTTSLLSEVSEYFNYSNCSVIIVSYSSTVADENTYRLNNTEYKHLHLSHNPVALFPPKFNYSLNRQTVRQTGHRFASRFSYACSLAIYDDNTSHEILSNPDALWWIRFYIPGGTFGSFHLFQHETNDQIIQKWNGSRIMRHAAHSSSSMHTKEKERLFSTTPNWNKAPLIQKINPGAGDPNLQYFKTSGEWDNYAVATVYYTAEYMNASLKFETVYSPPVRGILPSGRYDDYIQPLIDGTAQMATFYEPSAFPYGIVLSSKALLYGRAGFITAPPKLQMVSVLEALFLPFSLETWLVLLIIILGIFVLLLVTERLFSFSERVNPFDKLQNRNGTILRLFLGVSKAVLEQPSLEEDIHPVLRKLYFWRPLVCWSLLSTVLCALYKSELIGAFVRPTFISAPRNFDELSKSAYKINTILFFGNMDVAVRKVNDSLAQMLISRAEDVAWPDGMHEVC
jgi:hypothetical protein